METYCPSPIPSPLNLYSGISVIHDHRRRYLHLFRVDFKQTFFLGKELSPQAFLYSKYY